jgi:hypothetical protein
VDQHAPLGIRSSVAPPPATPLDAGDHRSRRVRLRGPA